MLGRALGGVPGAAAGGATAIAAASVAPLKSLNADDPATAYGDDEDISTGGGTLGDMGRAPRRVQVRTGRTGPLDGEGCIVLRGGGRGTAV